MRQPVPRQSGGPIDLTENAADRAAVSCGVTGSNAIQIADRRDDTPRRSERRPADLAYGSAGRNAAGGCVTDRYGPSLIRIYVICNGS